MIKLVIYSTKDSYIREYSPDSNYGSISPIYVSSESSKIRRSLFSFDISGVGSISSATLYARMGSATTSCSRTHYAQRITGAWTETNVTWNNQPTITTSNQASQSINNTQVGSWISWDITNLAKDETSSELDIRIIDSNEGSGICSFGYQSRESAYDPYIIIFSDYYVKTTGNDSLDGKSWTNAWKTINKAATTVVDGVTVHIGFGTYDAEPASNKIAPQNIGTSGIYYLPETATTGGGTGTVSVEQNT